MLHVLTSLALPGVVVSIVLQRVPNSDLSTIQSLSTAVSSIGDFDRYDYICFLQVDPPPGVGLIFGSVATESTAIERVSPPINGFGGTSKREC